jgi:hypothetical protein
MKDARAASDDRCRIEEQNRQWPPQPPFVTQSTLADAAHGN